MKPLKHIYAVRFPTKFGFGIQPTKGDTAKQARERFKKRYPKTKIIEVTRIHPTHPHFNYFKSRAL